MKGKICELCRKEATVYCGSDHAFLCWTCDEEVHGANFLVARHLRQLLCSNCKDFAGDSVSGVGLRRGPRSPTCRNCSPEEDLFPGEEQSDSSSVRTKRKTTSRVCSASEISGVESGSPARFSDEVSSRKKSGNDQSRPGSLNRFDAKAEGIFGNWCRDLRLSGDSAIAVVSAASDALRLCVERTVRVFPFRVFLAASFWYGLRRFFVCNNSARASHCLRRIEQVSGVPAKLILAVGLKIERESRAQNSRRRDLEEGWAECSG